MPSLKKENIYILCRGDHKNYKYNIEVVSTIYDNPELLGGE